MELNVGVRRRFCYQGRGQLNWGVPVNAGSGAAFRFAWNSKDWDFSNYDIFHTFTESNEVYPLAAEALGREFFILERNKETTKEEFISFIKSQKS